MKFNKSVTSRVKLPSLSVRKVSTSGQIPLTRKPLKAKKEKLKELPPTPSRPAYPDKSK